MDRSCFTTKSFVHISWSINRVSIAFGIDIFICHNQILYTKYHSISHFNFAEADETIDKLAGKAKDIVGDVFKNK